MQPAHSPLGRLVALTLLFLLSTAAPGAHAQNTTLAVKCTSVADCPSAAAGASRGATFCDTTMGVCALTTCGVNTGAGLACSLFNSSTYCTSLAGGGSCAPRLALDAPCNPALEVGSGMFSLPSIPGFNSNSSSIEQTNSQCMPGLKCDAAQNNTCKTDGPLGWLRYMWEAKRGTIIAIGVGILALLVCCCCWGCWMCGCAAVSTACMACSCLKSCCTCCCPSGSGGGGKSSGGGQKHQPTYAEPPAPVHVPAAPAAAAAASYSAHSSSNAYSGGNGGGGGGGGNITYHEASYSNNSGSASARPADSAGYAGKIVNIETEQIVMAPVSKPSPPPGPPAMASAPMPAPAPASYHSVPQQPMYAQPMMQPPQQPQQPPYGGGAAPTPAYVLPQPSGGSYGGSQVGYSGPAPPPQQGMPQPLYGAGMPAQHSGSSHGGYYQPDMQVTKEQMVYNGGGGGGLGYGQQPAAPQQYAAPTGGYAQQPAYPQGPPTQPQHQQAQQGYGYGGGNVYGR